MASTTFNLAVSADDGQASGTGASYPPTATAASDSTETIEVSRYLATTTYQIVNGLVRFDTSSLPDAAVIDSAVLRLWLTSVANQDGDRNLVAEYYDAGAITTADYTSTAVADAHAGTSISAFTDDADNDLALIGLAGINKTGYTGLRLHVSGGAPTLFNFITFASLDHATLTEPRLIVNYDSAGGGGGGHLAVATLGAG